MDKRSKDVHQKKQVHLASASLISVCNYITNSTFDIYFIQTRMKVDRFVLYNSSNMHLPL